MFCASCGTEQPDDSKFCRKCGLSLTTERSARKPRRRMRRMTVLSVLALVVVWAVAFVLIRANQVPASLRGLTGQHHIVQIGSSTVTVKNLGYAYTLFSVPPRATNVSVTGHFSASGGTGNDIEVYVLTADGFVNFQNGHQAESYYSSGRVTQGTISANLPSGAAQYYLIFNNGFSLLSAKSVQTSVALGYMD